MMLQLKCDKLLRFMFAIENGRILKFLDRNDEFLVHSKSSLNMFAFYDDLYQTILVF